MLKSLGRSPVVLFTAATAGAVGILSVGGHVSLKVARAGVRGSMKRHLQKQGVDCPVCRRRTTQDCQICKGQQILDWSPFRDPVIKRATACPACHGTGQQKCLNCVGEGVIAAPTSLAAS